MNTDSELFKKLVNDEYFNSIDVQPISKQTDLVLGNLYYIKYYFNDVVETVDEDGDIIEIPQVHTKEFGTLVPNPNSYNGTAPYLFNIKYRWLVNKGFTTVNPGGTVDVNGRRLGQDNHDSIYYDSMRRKPYSNSYMIYDIDLIKQKINSLKNNAKLNVVGKFTADDANTATSQVLTNPDMKSYISNFGGKRGKHRKTRKLRKIRKIRKHGTRRRKYYKYKK